MTKISVDGGMIPVPISLAGRYLKKPSFRAVDSSGRHRHERSDHGHAVLLKTGGDVG